MKRLHVCAALLFAACDQSYPPTHLSAWGLFVDGLAQEPAEGVVPYEVISPLFSDYASKHRFIRLPDGAQITYTDEGDWIYPSYREQGAWFWRGYTVKDFINRLFGNVQDPVKGRQMPVHHSANWLNMVSISSPVGTQIPQAVGVAHAAKLLGKDDVAMTFFGEGTSSTGEFHVAMNFAGVYQSPIVFFCQNNHWAISVPSKWQTASESFAVKAQAYGFEGVRVDGNDVLAVYRVTSEAVARARRGEGPTLIEALTYRLGPHTTADDASRYRDEGDVERWRAFDPIDRYRAWLVSSDRADEAFATGCEEEAADRATEVRAGVIATEPPPAEWMFEWVYSEPPGLFSRQRREALGG